MSTAAEWFEGTPRRISRPPKTPITVQPVGTFVCIGGFQSADFLLPDSALALARALVAAVDESRAGSAAG